MGFFSNIFNRSNDSRKVEVPDFNAYTNLSEVYLFFDWVLNSNESIANTAANKVHEIFEKAYSFKNKSLYNSLKYINIKPQDVSSFEKFEEDVSRTLFCIASMNGNGYVREKALQRLDGNLDLKSFPFILFRLNDWVPGIRNTSVQIVEGLIEDSKSIYLIRYNKLIDWLLVPKRADLTRIHSEILKQIFSEENIKTLLPEIDSYNESDRYYIFKNIINLDKADDEIRTLILKDKSYLIRLLAIKNMRVVEDQDVLKSILKDKSQKIRRYAIYLLREEHVEDYKEEIIKRLFDESSAIRQRVRDLLPETKENIYELYLNKVKSKPNSGAILGLAEVGGKQDIDLLKECLNSKYGKHRSAALYSLSIIDFQLAKVLSFGCLTDDANSVKRSAFSVLIKEPISSDLNELRSIYSKGDIDTKRYVLKIMGRHSGWSIAGDFLIAIQNGDKQHKSLAYSLLNGWHNYSMKLGVSLSEEDKDYVLKQYQDISDLNQTYPRDIEKIVSEIPFIFS